MPDSSIPFAPSQAAPIEFRCPNCQKLLRIAAAAAGKQAQCPECRTAMIVPKPPEPALQSSPVDGMATSGNSVASHPQTAPLASPAFAAALNPTPPVQGQDPPASTTSPMATPSVTSAPQAQPQSMSHLLSSTPSTQTSATKALFDRITAEVRKVYIGQDELVLGTLVALFSSGHVLIESVPGLGKTLFVRTLGRVLGCRFGRIQFTADLMPSDITGAPIFDMKTQEFRFHPGPVFTQLLLADEINRSPAKTHAALLEIMQEYRVTVERTSHKLERPFLVLATQNPIESEGTYNLPEAQLDRFMFKIVAEYPTAAEESQVLKLHSQQVDLDQRLAEELQTVTSPQEIVATTKACGQIHVDDKLIEYINTLVRRTREWPQFHMGASPRAGIALVQGARTLAAFYGRDYAVPDDVVQIALPVLRHRVILTAEADVEGQQVDELLRELIRTVEVPRL
jgi:MoxR-like ATPase